MTGSGFRKLVWKYSAEHGRHSLPWRKTHDPYKVLVSEMMLQQTQVDRVIPYFNTWMKKYPNVKALSKAPLSDVLISWQGLGYNRRAKMLHEAMKEVMATHGGKMPRTVKELEALPGVGPYTARAVAAFAYNQDVTFIETNIRTAVIHHFFTDRSDIPDTEVLAQLTKISPQHPTDAAKDQGAREWYAALMDYGAHLKRLGVRVNAKSKGYIKQSAFIGSGREVRGAFLRMLTSGPATKTKLLKLFPQERHAQCDDQIRRLLVEGLIEKEGRTYCLPS